MKKSKNNLVVTASSSKQIPGSGKGGRLFCSERFQDGAAVVASLKRGPCTSLAHRGSCSESVRSVAFGSAKSGVAGASNFWRVTRVDARAVCVSVRTCISGAYRFQLCAMQSSFTESGWNCLFRETIVVFTNFLVVPRGITCAANVLPCPRHRRNDICVFQHNILKHTFGHISCIGRPLLGDVGKLRWLTIMRNMMLVLYYSQ